MKPRYVYFFGDGRAEGRGSWTALLGSKGAGLAEMTRLGLRVPAGLTITTKTCLEYYASGHRYPSGLWEEVLSNLKRVERAMDARFGDQARPLLVSVRSGAPVSMPGMMDTVLNVGMNERVLQGLSDRSQDPRFAYDTYRRFIEMFSDIVMGVDRAKFMALLARKKAEQRVTLDTELSVEALKNLVSQYLTLVTAETRRPFPSDPLEQLRMSIHAVFESWHSPRAVEYRKIHHIPHTLGTAVSVVAMVYGNMGKDSGTGVAFTRNPKTGAKRLFAECLLNAQGEDVVSGSRTPFPLEVLAKRLPSGYRALVKAAHTLERHYRDMVDIEFTIQNGTFYLLQVRPGKRTVVAAIKIAEDLVKERMLDVKAALLKIDPEQLDHLLHPMIDTQERVTVIAKGLPASPGAAVGHVVFDAEEAVRRAGQGDPVLLVRPETSPKDIKGMKVAQGILTARGGETSHAALVARGMGKCCVVGCEALRIDEGRRQAKIGAITLHEGDLLTLNGSTGEVILGQARLIRPKPSEVTRKLRTPMRWATAVRRLRVRANADTPEDARTARQYGAEGIGLCRTEHMFFEGDRIKAMREMILSDTVDERRKALAKILPFQKGDFIEIFKVMEGYPVTIRLLDPPLHEFLPKTEDELKELTREMGVSLEVLRAKNERLHELNPMLGHRGCRLGITYPEIYEMQVRAICEAACELRRQGGQVFPEVMIPLVVDVRELERLRALCEKTADEVMTRYRIKLKYEIGTMIELPRAAVVADAIATVADFFSFGTNDLTQMVYGLSRDDYGKFIPFYLNEGLLDDDPFMTLDQEGVGLLMKMGVEKGRATRPDLKVGICGEHGGDPRSIEFFHQIGLDYVSCSPYRVPIAKLAAAQAAIRHPFSRRRGPGTRR